MAANSSSLPDIQPLFPKIKTQNPLWHEELEAAKMKSFSLREASGVQTLTNHSVIKNLTPENVAFRVFEFERRFWDICRET